MITAIWKLIISISSLLFVVWISIMVVFFAYRFDHDGSTHNFQVLVVFLLIAIWAKTGDN